MFPFDTINFILGLIVIAKVISIFKRPEGCPNAKEVEDALEDEG